MDFGLHFEVQNHKKSKKTMSKSSSNLETENIAKKEFDARLASGAVVPGTEEFEESGEDSERTETKNFKHAGTCLRQGAADLMG